MSSAERTPIVDPLLEEIVLFSARIFNDLTRIAPQPFGPAARQVKTIEGVSLVNLDWGFAEQDAENYVPYMASKPRVIQAFNILLTQSLTSAGLKHAPSKNAEDFADGEFRTVVTSGEVLARAMINPDRNMDGNEYALACVTGHPSRRYQGDAVPKVSDIVGAGRLGPNVCHGQLVEVPAIHMLMIASRTSPDRLRQVFGSAHENALRMHATAALSQVTTAPAPT